MTNQPLAAVLDELPTPVAADIRGYVASIEASAKEIFADARVSMDAELLEQFLLLMGVRRLWAMVNGQYWILGHSLSLLSRQGVDEVRLLGASYGYDSPEFHSMRELRSSLEAVLRQLGLSRLVAERTPRGALVKLARSRGSGRPSG